MRKNARKNEEKGGGVSDGLGGDDVEGHSVMKKGKEWQLCAP